MSDKFQMALDKIAEIADEAGNVRRQLDEAKAKIWQAERDRDLAKSQLSEALAVVDRLRSEMKADKPEDKDMPF